MPLRHKSLLIPGLILLAALPSFALKRADLLPADAMASVRISNTTSFWDKLQKSPIGRLWTDPQFQTFLGNPDADLWSELLFDGEKTPENDMTMEQLKMLSGEVALAMVKDSDDPYIVVAMTEEDFRRSLALDDKLAEDAEEPVKIIRGSFQDVDVIQHIEAAGTEDEASTWQAYLNNTLVMGPDKEWVEKSIVRIKKEAVEEPTGNPEISMDLPLSRLIQTLLKESREDSDMQPLFESLGLMGLEHFTVRVVMNDETMVIDNTLAATSLDKGIFTLLDTAPVNLPSVGFIPENICLLEVGRINLLRLWQEIPTVPTTAAPPVKPQFDFALGMIRQQLGIDMEQDLIAHLGTQYLGFSTADSDMMTTVLALQLKDSAGFRNGLETIMNAPAMQPQVAAALETINFLDHTLYVTKNTAPADTISVAVVGNYLIYSQPEGVRQVIRSQTSEAAANPRFEQTELVQGLRSHTPSDACGYSVVDWNKYMGFMIRELTKPQIAQIIAQKWATSGAPIPPPDFSKLPPADHLASFFNRSYQYLPKTNRGLHQNITIKY